MTAEKKPITVSQLPAPEPLATIALAQISELQKQTRTIEQQQVALIDFMKTYTDKITALLVDLQKMGNRNTEWAKEFHRLLINEYAQYSSRVDKVFSLLYTQIDNHDVKRISLILAPNFQRAQLIGEEILQKEQEDPKQWLIEGWQQLDIPDVQSRDVVATVDKSLINPNKPIGVFLNDLQLVRDRFAVGAIEKKTITKIIKRIDKKTSKPS
jgi:hypothetical protein